jgi:D-threonate/D-erythronate kinase
VATVDARSDGDLSRAASAILEAGPSVIPVGSAGLAEALAEQLNGGKVAERELPGRMIGTSDPRILIQVTSLNPVSRGQAVKLMAACPDVVVLLAPAERVGNLSVAERLGAEFAALVAQQHWDVLGLVGGDGARAALQHLGASGIRIVNTLLEGIPFGFVVGGRADGIPVFTKAGGFGSEDALVRVVERISK